MNRAKRKARQAVSKQRSREPADDATPTEEPDRKRIKSEENKVKDEPFFSGNIIFELLLRKLDLTLQYLQIQNRMMEIGLWSGFVTS